MMERPANTGDLARIVHNAHDSRTALRIVAQGTWLTAGGQVPPTAARLELGALTGITSYVPGDLTLTARAATTLEELNTAAAENGQWCPLLPWGDDSASVGAVFATGTSGPFARTLGRPRDVALGMEFVDGTGATVRAGGKVVKNVAGFDLTRLLVGSWGTLGVITEVTVRLRAQPLVDETFACCCDPSDHRLREQLTALERGPLAPLAIASVTLSPGAAMGMPGDTNTLVRLGGNRSFVAAARRALREIVALEPCDPMLWLAARRSGADDSALDFSTALSDPISRRIWQQFDPRGILNPGVLGGLPS